MPAPEFTDAEVLEIRHQQSRGTLDVRVWADTKMCSIETVRRVARGDTYRHVAGVKAHPSYGGLHAAGFRPAVGHQSPVVPAAPFIAPASLPDLAEVADDASEAAIAASFARLQAELALPVPGNPQASAAVSLLDELQAIGESQRPSQSLARPDAELG